MKWALYLLFPFLAWSASPVERVYVGELQERWLLPSDHLPIGIAIEGGRTLARIVSWNVLNSAYLPFIYENGQGLADSVLTREDIPLQENGLTVREGRALAMLLKMAKTKQLICLQECSELFLQELQARLPQGLSLIRSMDEEQVNQNAILYDAGSFSFVGKTLHRSVFSEGRRPLMEALFEKEGVRYRIFNAHLRCGDPLNSAELADFVHGRKQEQEVTLILGDLNVEQRRMIESIGCDAFLPFTPYKTTVSPELHSKAIDHIFVDFGTTGLTAHPEAPEALLEGLQASVDLLESPCN